MGLFHSVKLAPYFLFGAWMSRIGNYVAFNFKIASGILRSSTQPPLRRLRVSGSLRKDTCFGVDDLHVFLKGDSSLGSFWMKT